MRKEEILSAIRQIAERNAGQPPGHLRFERETGIRQADWYRVHWARWSEALEDAGLRPNEPQSSYDKEFLIGKFIDLVRKLGRIPTQGDLRIEARKNKPFPSTSTFSKGLGTKAQIVSILREYCRGNPILEDVTRILGSATNEISLESNKETSDEISDGFVYLIKWRREYKIGRSNDAGRRAYEVSLQLPEKSDLIHQIKTDDPKGIEEYWHRRFAGKRKNGEWFALDGNDVRAFKRRRFQ